MPPDHTGRLEETAKDPSTIRQLIEAFPEATLLFGSRNTVWYANIAARDLLGVTQSEGARSQFLRMPELIDALDTIAKDETRTVRYRELVPFDRWIEAHVTPVSLGGKGQQQPFLVVLQDLTESERLERMRADFVANVSHELRTPLASLAGFIETLKGAARDDAEARQRFLEIMDAQAKRMSRLISDLLALSRIELDEHIRPKAVVDLGDIAAGVVESLRLTAEKQSIDLTLKRDNPVPMLGSGDELARLVENLVENAIKYGGDGGRVSVDVTAEQDGEEARALIAIKDSGPGIAPEHLPRLTERFYRVDADESRTKGGTGLGLAIVKHIVARHRGKLTVQSTLGKGTVFSVRFDLAE